MSDRTGYGGHFSGQMNEEELLRAELAAIKQEHRDLDQAVEALHAQGRTDMLSLQRLKRRKLALKDRIALIEDKLLPDIIA